MEHPDLLTPVAGVPILVRSVRGLLGSGLVGRVLLLGSGERRVAIESACSGMPVETRDGSLPDWLRRHARFTVRAHDGQRAAASIGDGSDGDVLVVHDADRPLTPSALVVDVVEAIVAGRECAVPVLPMSDSVKTVDAAGLVRGTPDRAGLRVVQGPRAFRTPRPSTSEFAVHTVPGHPLAFPITGPWDLELAEILLQEGQA